MKRGRQLVPALVPAAILVLGLLLCLPAAAVAADASELLPAGEAAPAIVSVTMEGKPFVLEEELAGGPVFLVFWSIF